MELRQDIQEQQQQTPDPSPKSQKLYDNLIKDGYTAENLGTPEAFQSMLSDSAKAKKLYSNLINDGYTQDNLGSESDFLKNVMPEVKETPIDLAFKSAELKKKGTWVGGGGTGGGGGYFQPDLEARKQAEEIEKGLQEKGIDPNLATSLFSNKNLSPELKEHYSQQLAENPNAVIREVNHVDWKSALEAEANVQKEGAEEWRKLQIDKALSAAQKSGQAGNYQYQRQNFQEVAKAIRTIMPEPEKYLEKFGQEAAFAYGANLLPAYENGGITKRVHGQDFITDEAWKAGLNDLQISALNYLQDIKPELFESFKGVLIPEKDFDKNDTDLMVGRDEKLKRLEEIGIKLKADAAREIRDTLLQKGDVTAASIYQDELANALNYSSALMNNYPRLKTLEASKLADELAGEKDNPVDRWVKVTGKGTGSFVKGIWDIVSEPFRSEKNSQMHLMAVLGDEKISGTITNSAQSNELTQSMEVSADKGLQAGIDVIQNSTLDDKEKRRLTEDLIYENIDKVKVKGIDPKTNLSIKSLARGVTDMFAGLIPFIAAEMTTGGIATTGLGALNKEAAIAGLTVYHDELARAVDEGVANPNATAFRRTLVNGYTMAGVGTAEKLKAIAKGFKNPAMREVVEKMSNKELQAMIDGAVKKESIGSQMWQKVVESAKSSAKISAAISAGNAANQIIDNKDISGEELARTTMTEAGKMFLMTTAMGMLGLPFKKASDINKLSLYEAGRTPDVFLKEIDIMKQEGKLSDDQYNEYKNNIALAKKVYENTPMVDADGKPLKDQAARDLMVEKFKIAKLEELSKKDIPVPLQEKVQAQLAEAKVQAETLQQPEIAKPESDIIQQESVKPVEETPVTNEPTTAKVDEPVQPDVAEPKMQEPEASVKSKTQEIFQKGVDLFQSISETEGGTKKRRLAEERRKLFENEPSLQRIDANISEIYRQMEENKLITKKGNCP